MVYSTDFAAQFVCLNIAQPAKSETVVQYYAYHIPLEVRSINHITAVMARRIKFILEKQAFISFAFDTHKGKYGKLKKSIFPSNTGNRNQISEINKFLVAYFGEVIKRIPLNDISSMRKLTGFLNGVG